MNQPLTGGAVPPPIPNSKSNWLFPSLLTLAGIFLTTGLFYYVLGISIWGGFSGMLGEVGIFGDYSMFSVLLVALVTDTLIERRTAIVAGALVTVGGIILMMTGFSLALFPGLVLLAIGNAMMLTSLYAYFGGQWDRGGKGGGKVLGYALAFGVGMVGGGLGDLFATVLVGDLLIFSFLGAILIMGGFAFVFWLGMQSNMLKPEPGAVNKKGKGLIGMLILAVFAIFSFVGFGLIYYLNPGDESVPLFFLFLTLIIILVTVISGLVRPGLLVRDKFSIVSLPVIVALFVLVQEEGGRMVWSSADSMSGVGNTFAYDLIKLANATFNAMILGVVLVLFVVGWWFRKRFHAELWSGLFLVVGALLVVLFPELINEAGLLELSIGAQVLVDGIFLIGYAMVFAYLYAGGWKFFPVQYRGAGFALIFCVQHMVYNVRRILFSIEFSSEEGGGGSTAHVLLVLGFLLLVAAAVVVRWPRGK